ncbi:MAG TPA: M48 family metallopeptidase [Elusimicrobiota bacterium]|nr:M48 family metallopeptidase [Elusimicrobiota bacterium]
MTGCPKVPVTGRHSLILLPESEELTLGVDAYRQVLSQNRLARDPAAVALVRRVGERIAKISDRPDYDWEYNVLDDPKTVNAFCLPGGKVAVYTGILPVTQTDAGLAVVLGHEIAHAIAKHGAERMSQGLLLQLGQESLAMAMKNRPTETRAAVLQAFGLGATVGAVLPFGRFQESEADRIGLIYMARAGYDPREAVAFWKRMESAGGGAPPEFLSTHPSHETRVRDLEKWMPDALKAYEEARGR